jgi:hypothetical protein
MSFGLTMAGLSSILLPAAIGAAGGAGIGALTSEDGFSDDGWWKGAIGGGLLGGIGGGMGMFGGAAAAPTPLVSAFGTPAAASVTPNLASLGAAPGGLLGSNSTALAGITPSFSSAAGIQAAALPEFASTGALGVGGTASALAGITPASLSSSAFLQGLPGVTAPTAGFLEGMMPSQDMMTKGLLASKVFGALSSDKKKEEPYMSPARISPISRPGAHSPLPYRMGGGFMGGGQRGSTLGSRRY